MSIKAVDSDEVAFEPSFRERLPAVEKIMIANGLDPALFKITKGRNRSGRSYYGTGRYYDYEVNTGEDKFVVSFATDAGFLEYFLNACTESDDSDDNGGSNVERTSTEEKHSSLMERFAQWVHPHR
jgi:hypothetical protein